MQRLIFLLSFLLTSLLLRATDVPKLNLTIGKKYQIETTYLQDSSESRKVIRFEKCLYEFTPTHFDPRSGNYDIELRLKYLKNAELYLSSPDKWVERDVYETGFVTNFRNPKVFLNMCQIPIRFKLSVNNKVVEFDLSEYANYQSPEKLQLAALDKFARKEIAQEIWALFFDTQKKRSSWKHEMDVRHTLQKTTEDESLQTYSCSQFPDVGPRSNNPEAYQNYCRNVTVDKQSGLILNDQLSFEYHFAGLAPIIRTQRLVSSLNPPFVNEERIGNNLFEPVTISEPNVSIRIRLNDRPDVQFLNFRCIDPDQLYTRSFRVKKNGRGEFIFQAAITFPISIFVEDDPSLLPNNSIAQLLLIPGDRLLLEVNPASSTQPLVYSGIGADRNNTYVQVRDIFKKSGSKPSAAELSSVLIRQRAVLEPERYLDLLADVSHRIRNFSAYNSTPGTGKNVVGEFNLPLNNTAISDSYSQLHYINKYLLAEMNKAGHLDYGGQKEQIRRTINFSSAFLGDPVLASFKAYLLTRYLFSFTLNEDDLIVKTFLEEYKNTRYADRLRKALHVQSIYKPGHVFPESELTDINGVKVSLAKSYGKPVLIRYCFQWGTPKTMIKAWKEENIRIKEIAPKIKMIRIVTGDVNKKDEIRAAIDDSIQETVIFQDHKDVVFSKIPGRAYLYSRDFLLGRGGIIRKSASQFDYAELYQSVREITDSDFSLKRFRKWWRVAFLVLSSLLSGGLLTYWIIRRVSARKQKRAELLQKMRELELSVIRTQMNPHFMYNCLNSIQNLVHKNKNEEAHLYLSKFASLVRQTLNNSKKEEISLDKELDFIREYIELEQLRFNFEFKIEIGSEINRNNIFVPPMLLQPFVENSILHGLIAKKYDRLLEVWVLKNQNRIELIIHDNGIGRKAAEKSGGNGQGILLSTNRLALLSEKTGIKYDLKTDDLYDEAQSPCGTRVSISFMEED